MRLFWERGYEGTSIDELSTEMEINRPSLYGSFGSKEELFREAVRRYSLVEGEPIERAMSEARDTRSAIEAFLRTNASAYSSESKPGGCMVVLSALAGTPESRNVRTFLSGMRKDDQVFLEKRIRAGQYAGDLDGDVDAEGLARFYITVLQGLSIQARDGATLEQMNAVISTAMSAWPL